MSNPSMPGLVKIGCTDRSPSERISELSSSTGVPTPFILEYAVFVEEHGALEQHLHQLFDSSRVNGSREFFNLTVEDVVREVRAQQVASMAQEIANWDQSTKLSLLTAILADSIIANSDQADQLSLLRAIITNADISKWDEATQLSLLRAIIAKAPQLREGPQLRPQHLDYAIAMLTTWDDVALMKLVDSIVQKHPAVRSALQ